MDDDAPRKKSGGIRTLVIVFAVFGALSIVGCVVCGLSGSWWVASNAEQLRADGARVQAEAAAYAASHAQAECVDEALARGDACGDPMAIMCHAQAGVFLRGCLGAAAPSPALCDGVPAATEIMAGAQWAVAECGRRGRPGDQQCAQLLRAVVEHCAAR